MIRYAYSGQLNTALGNLPAGTPFSGELAYEQNQVDTTPNTPSVGDYNYSMLSLLIGGNDYSSGVGRISIYSNPDVIEVASSDFDGSIGGVTLQRMGMTLANANGTLYNGVPLPGANLTLAPFGPPGTAYLELLHSGLRTYGKLTSLTAIPEPSGAVLSLSAACLPLLSRRRRTGSRFSDQMK